MVWLADGIDRPVLGQPTPSTLRLNVVLNSRDFSRLFRRRPFIYTDIRHRVSPEFFEEGKNASRWRSLRRHMAISGAPFSYRNRTPHLYEIFNFSVTVRHIKGIYILAAPPLIGQERSRNIPTPLQKNKKIG